MAAFSHVLVRAEGDGIPTPQYTTATLTTTYDNPNVDVGDVSDEFGYSLALSGSRVIVGARNEDAGAVADTGKAYQFNGSTTQTLSFHNPSDGVSDYFGASVAIENSYVVIGAPGDDNPELDSGKTYLYNVSGGPDGFPGTPTTPIHVWSNPNNYNNAPNSDQFGAAVAISGQYVVISAPYEDETGVTNGGLVYVYNLGSKSINQTISQPSSASNEYFGTSVDIEGYYVVVGAPGRTNDQGAAYVYNAASGGNPILTFTNPDTDATANNDNFGESVSVSGNYVIVGAHNEDVGGNLSTGAAYVFDMNSVTPTVPILTLTNPDTVAGQFDYFGYSVSISGGYAIVGAYGQDSITGVAYVYKIKDNATPSVPVATITNPGGSPGDFFGDKVLISGNNILIGAKGANKVYQYTLS